MPRPRTFGPRPAPEDLRAFLDFLNTAERHVRYYGKLRIQGDKLSGRERMDRWLADHGIVDPDVVLSPEEGRRILTIRDAFRELVASGRPDDPQALERLRPFAEAVRLRVGFDEARNPVLEPVGESLEATFASWIWLFVQARLESRWRRVKLCEACQVIFYDRSRTCVAKWCSTVCGDRLRGRRRPPRPRSRKPAPPARRSERENR